MYYADLLNHMQLFQRLGSWPSGEGVPTSPLHGELLSRLSSATASFLRMKDLEAACAKQFATQVHHIESPRSRLAFWSPSFVQYIAEFSTFLGAARVAQNQIVPLFASLSKITGLPSSLEDAVKKFAAPPLPKDFKHAVTVYWGASGLRVKQYRDVDQHFASFLSHAFIEAAPPYRVAVFLPDNPEVKSRNKFTFSQELRATDFFERVLKDLDLLIDGAGAAFGLPRAAIRQSLTMAPATEVIEGERSTFAIMFADDSAQRGVLMGQSEDKRVWVRQFLPESKP